MYIVILLFFGVKCQGHIYLPFDPFRRGVFRPIEDISSCFYYFFVETISPGNIPQPVIDVSPEEQSRKGPSQRNDGELFYVWFILQICTHPVR